MIFICTKNKTQAQALNNLSSSECELPAGAPRKSKMVAMRFSPTDHTAIKKQAEKAKMNFTEFITLSALNKPIVIIDGLDEVQKEQKAIGRNLNQITTLCNMGKITVPDLEEVKSGFSVITQKLNDILNRCS